MPPRRQWLPMGIIQLTPMQEWRASVRSGKWYVYWKCSSSLFLLTQCGSGVCLFFFLTGTVNGWPPWYPLLRLTPVWFFGNGMSHELDWSLCLYSNLVWLTILLFLSSFFQVCFCCVRRLTSVCRRWSISWYVSLLCLILLLFSDCPDTVLCCCFAIFDVTGYVLPTSMPCSCGLLAAATTAGSRFLLVHSSLLLKNTGLFSCFFYNYSINSSSLSLLFFAGNYWWPVAGITDTWSMMARHACWYVDLATVLLQIGRVSSCH